MKAEFLNANSFHRDPHHGLCGAVALGARVAGWRICDEAGGLSDEVN